MRKRKLFGTNIPPSCEYCLYYVKNNGGRPACRRGNSIIGNPCRGYAYDPLKREPKAMPDLPKFTADDFKL